MLCSVMPSHKVPRYLLKGTEPFYWNTKIKTFFGDVETAKQIKVIAFSFFPLLHICHLSSCKEYATKKYKKNASVPIENVKGKFAFKMSINLYINVKRKTDGGRETCGEKKRK